MIQSLKQTLLMKLISFLLLLCLSFNSFAFTGTEKPVVVIIPFSAGGTVTGFFNDLQRYAATRGIEMRPSYHPGGQGVIAFRELYSLPSDGYAISITLLDFISAYKDSTNNDVDPNNIFYLHQTVAGIVSKNANIKTMADIQNRLKPNKSGLSFGFASPAHAVILNNVFTQMGDTHNIVMVNYKSSVTIITDTFSDSLDVAIGSFTNYDQYVKTGRLHLIAVTSNNPLPSYPSVPTLRSLYPNIPESQGGSCVVVNSTNGQVVSFWKQLVTDYKNSAKFKERANTEFYEIKALTPADISRTISEGVLRIQTTREKK